MTPSDSIKNSSDSLDSVDSGSGLTQGHNPKQPPKSATSGIHIAISALVFALCLILFKLGWIYHESNLASGIFILAMITATHFILDSLFLKTHTRKSTGLDFSKTQISWTRTTIKLLGLMGTIGFIAVLYSLFPEYQSEFYSPYWALLKYLSLPWSVLAVPYFLYVDSKMTNPNDGYYQVGQVVLFRLSGLDFKVLKHHLLGWIVKSYFLPLMFVYFYNGLTKFKSFSFNQELNFSSVYPFLYDLIFLADVAIVSMGYLFSLRLFDSHQRSAEPTVLGWAVALICYQPFWSLISRQYLHYGSEANWIHYFQHHPLLYIIWGSLILILLAIYLWSSFMFGVRFSNLTHRGIITNGPYRYTRHPAYLSKNIAWWLISVPFLTEGPVTDNLKKCSLLLLLNSIYFLRAKTEERHLSNDPDYQQYAKWIDNNGLFSQVLKMRLFSLLKYNSDQRSQL